MLSAMITHKFYLESRLDILNAHINRIAAGNGPVAMIEVFMCEMKETGKQLDNHVVAMETYHMVSVR